MFMILTPDGTTIPLNGCKLVQVPTLKEGYTVERFVQNPNYMEARSASICGVYQAYDYGEIVVEAYENEYLYDTLAECENATPDVGDDHGSI